MLKDLKSIKFVPDNPAVSPVPGIDLGYGIEYVSTPDTEAKWHAGRRFLVRAIFCDPDTREAMFEISRYVTIGES